MSLINKPNSPQNGETNDVTLLNENDDSIINVVNGNLDDTNIKDYAIDETSQATSDAGAIGTLLNGIGYVLKAITGKTNWYDSPSIDLESINDGSAVVGEADKIDGYDIQKNGTDGTGVINFKT